MTGLAGVWATGSRPPEPPRFDVPPQAVSADGRLCGWYGRLDEPAAADPAAFALDLHARRGAAALRDLVGDWSLALWDSENSELALASDYAGTRPLYYRRDAWSVHWSSSLTDLAAVAGPPELDDRYFAALLTGRSTGVLTPYRGIVAVPAGCVVRLHANGESVERFWNLPVGAGLRLDASATYEERLRELFRDAVTDRVRGHERVCCELSGGLDSTSVAAVALRIHSKVTTLSYTHPGAADEPYIRAVEQQHGIAGVHLDVRECPFVTAERTGGPAPSWWEPRYRDLARELHQRGATALLTGQIGDLTMGNLPDDSEQVAAPLRHLRFGQAAREAYAWSQSLRVPIYPILWRAARMAASSWAPPETADLSPIAWQRVSRENSLGERLLRIGEAAPAAWALDWRAAMPDRRRRFRALASWLDTRRLQTPEPLLHIDYSHPFADRRLVEFMLAIPPAEIVRPDEPRRLMRRAFAELLPEPVLRRRSKASFGAFYDDCLTPLAREMRSAPDRLRVVELGYLDRAGLLDRLGRYLAGTDCNAVQLRTAILVEFWLRTASYR